MALHKDVTGTDNHEPKGVEGASSGEVYVADGAGSGAWTALSNAYSVALTGLLSDISTASTIYFTSPIAGTISRVSVTLQAAITTADSIVTGAIGGTPIGGLSITVAQSGSAAGSSFSDSSISGSNTVSAGSVISIATDGASSGTAPAIVTVLIDAS